MDTGARQEVRNRVQEAIALYENSGKDAALAEIADPAGKFVKAESFIFALDLRGNMIAHPFDRKLTGKNVLHLQDSQGKSFIRKIVETAGTKGYGFIEYMWLTPKSREERWKTVFFERANGLIFCGGFYERRETRFPDLFECLRFYGPPS